MGLSSFSEDKGSVISRRFFGAHKPAWERNDIDRDAEIFSRGAGRAQVDPTEISPLQISLFGNPRQDIQVQAHRHSYWARPSEVREVASTYLSEEMCLIKHDATMT